MSITLSEVYELQTKFKNRRRGTNELHEAVALIMQAVEERQGDWAEMARVLLLENWQDLAAKK